MQVLTFSLEGSTFGLPTSVVGEVIRMPSLTALPGAPVGLLGLMNLRGRMLPVVDPRFWLHIASEEQLKHVVVVLGENESMGLAVEQVDSIIETPVHEDVPDMVDERLKPLIAGYFQTERGFVFVWHSHGPYFLWDLMHQAEERLS
ncbi:chemotaxis protein CheW [Sulfobacillus thermosulfidooxidans]|uniref:chemotaxis protein CheW n=1 Tax=Sulfobacillus thermosulfidooxidans TaxID=28034 RepID=UPI0006B5ADF0|nr:chemotaxis protein CheW [Sulfobacillus thermosulfidooxidans]